MQRLITSGQPLRQPLDYTALTSGAGYAVFRLHIGGAGCSGGAPQDPRQLWRGVAQQLSLRVAGHLPVRFTSEAYWEVALDSKQPNFAALHQEFSQRGGLVTVSCQGQTIAIPCRELPPPPPAGQRVILLRKVPVGAAFDTLPAALLMAAGYSPAVARRGCPLTQPTQPGVVILLGVRFGRSRHGEGVEDGSTVVATVLPPANDPALRHLPPLWRNPWDGWPHSFQSLVVGDQLSWAQAPGPATPASPPGLFGAPRGADAAAQPAPAAMDLDDRAATPLQQHPNGAPPNYGQAGGACATPVPVQSGERYLHVQPSASPAAPAAPSGGPTENMRANQTMPCADLPPAPSPAPHPAHARRVQDAAPSPPVQDQTSPHPASAACSPQPTVHAAGMGFQSGCSGFGAETSLGSPSQQQHARPHGASPQSGGGIAPSAAPSTATGSTDGAGHGFGAVPAAADQGATTQPFSAGPDQRRPVPPPAVPATHFGGTGFGAAATAAAQGTTAQPLSAGPTMGQPDLPQGSAPAPLGGTGFGAGFAAPAAPQAEPAAREGQIRAGTEGGRGGGQRRQGASLHARQQAGVRVDCPSWMQQREPSSPAAQQRDERQKQREQRRAELQQQAERRKAPAVRDGSPRARNMELDTPADLGGSASAGCEAAPAQARAGAARQSGGGETPRWEGTQLLSLATQYVMDALEVRRREAVRMLQPIFQQHSPSWAAAYLLGREGAMRVLPSIVSRVIDRQLGIPGYGVGSDTSSNSGSDSRRNGHSSHPWSPHRPNTPGSRSARARCDAVGNAPGAQGHRR